MQTTEQVLNKSLTLTRQEQHGDEKVTCEYQYLPDKKQLNVKHNGKPIGGVLGKRAADQWARIIGNKGGALPINITVPASEIERILQREGLEVHGDYVKSPINGQLMSIKDMMTRHFLKRYRNEILTMSKQDIIYCLIA